MSRKSRLLVAIACVTSAMLVTRASIDPSLPAPQTPAPAPTQNAVGNLLLQPEAARISRRLGKRFGRMVSVMTGTLTIDGSERPITITRRPQESGEKVELFLAGRALTSPAEQGDTAPTRTETEELLIERLVYDSPDYFVLAQLGGASYLTVARNVRLDDAPDNYDGPLWTLVRVEDSLPDDSSRLGSKWRLFYLNTVTGLVDKIVSEVQGQRIEASFSDWREALGERFPATITWTSNGQTLMILNLANLSIAVP